MSVRRLPMRLGILFCGFGPAGAQFAGGGVAKSAYGAQTDPSGGMAFIQKYFGAYATGGPCPADIWNCTAGESEAWSDWFAYQGRAQLLREGDSWGECLLRTNTSGPTFTEAVPGLIQVAVGLSPRPGECEFFQQANMPAADGDEGYAVTSFSKADCCKVCAALETCVGASFTLNTTQPPPLPGMGFGLHLPGITDNLTTGGLSVKDVEAIFSDKMGDMTEFDSFMDFNVGLFTANIDYYLERFSADGVPYLAAKWSNSSGPSPSHMYSVFVCVPSSQMVIELIAASSDILAAGRMLLSLEQRVSDPAMEAIRSSPPTYPVLLAVKVSRAATDLAALDAFYVDGMGTQTVLSLDGDDVSARCYQWPGATADVCFVKRPGSDTKGHFKVGDLERMFKNVSDTVVTDPYCLADRLVERWEDNHYAYYAPDDSDVNFDHIATYLDDNPSSKYICTSSGLRYVFDPTGWAVQLDINWTKAPSRCNLTVPELDIRSDFCNGGICEASPLTASSPEPGPRRELVQDTPERAQQRSSVEETRPWQWPCGLAVALGLVTLCFKVRRRMHRYAKLPDCENDDISTMQLQPGTLLDRSDDQFADVEDVDDREEGNAL